MLDFLNHPLSVGQHIVQAVRVGNVAELRRGVIVGFGENYYGPIVRVHWEDNTTGYFEARNGKRVIGL